MLITAWPWVRCPLCRKSSTRPFCLAHVSQDHQPAERLSWDVRVGRACDSCLVQVGYFLQRRR